MAVLGIAGGAFAYFSGSGSGTGQTAAIGTASGFDVTFATPSGTMYPGSGTATVPVTVTNTGNGTQQLTSVTPTVNSDASGNVTSGGTAVSGCLAAWFSAAGPTSPTLPVTLQPSGQTADTYSGNVTVTMTDSGTNQDPCQGKTPDITVRAS